MVWEVFIVILLVLILAAGLFSYIMKKRHYRVIDQLDQQKKEVSKISLANHFKKGNQLKLSGKTENHYNQLVGKWSEVEAKKLPSVENQLFEAERAVDLLRFKKAKQAEEKAESLLTSTRTEIEQIKKNVEKILRNETENQRYVEEIQEQYKVLRKKLLTQSFTFGPALEELENRLSEVERKFTVFSSITSEGDHIEAQKVLDQIKVEIQEMNDYLSVIPEQLEMLEAVFPPEIEELKSGYHELRKEGFLFPDDTILEDTQDVEEKIDQAKELIGSLQLKEADLKIDEIDKNLDKLYQKMEVEIEAKQTVRKDAVNLRRAFHYLLEQNRRLRIETDRIKQSYLLDEKTIQAGPDYKIEIEEIRKQFEQVQEKITDQTVVFSAIKENLREIFEELNRIHDEQEMLLESVLQLRPEELRIKKHVDEMENALRELKREVEMQHLPGLQDEYLEIFYYVSDRLEELARELGQIRMDMTKAQELETICEEEVQKLTLQTQQMIHDARMTELTMQYISRYRAQHLPVEEAMEKSITLFRQEFAYDESLAVLRKALEKIEPGAYEKIHQRAIEDGRLHINS